MSSANEDGSKQNGSPLAGASTSPRWPRVLVATAAVVAAALLGASGALLVAGSGEQDTSPNAADVGFAQDMAAHHRQGVEMARIAMQRSTDTEVRQLAYDIAATQNEQMGRMHGWLALWSKATRPTGGEHMSWMRGWQAHAAGQSEDDGRLMPGMATSAELDRLGSLPPPELETYFLRLMIRHHQGGAPMMRSTIEQADVGAVRNLAGKMLIAQTAEMKTMKGMLADRGADPLPNPVQ